MTKIIVKTALKVLVALIIALLIAFTAASLGVPGKMADFFEKRENYSFAAGYASLQYRYSGKTEDLAHCVQDYVFAKDDKNTVRTGDMLLADDGFSDFAKAETERLELDYTQYICGKIACAKYRRGDKDGALALARSTVEGSGRFPKNNALVQLVLEVNVAKDGESAQKIKPVLENIAHYEDESEYLLSVLKAVNGIIGAE